jgi:hypothetical protein
LREVARARRGAATRAASAEAQDIACAMGRGAVRVVKPARAERSAAKDARREVRAGCHRRPRASHRTGAGSLSPIGHVALVDRPDTTHISIPDFGIFETEKIFPF